MKFFHQNQQNNTIVIIFFNLGLGGIQRKIVDIANCLSENSQYTINILLRDYTEFSMIPLLKKQNIYIHYRPTILNKKIRMPFAIYILWFCYLHNTKSIFTFLVLSTTYAVIVRYLLFWKKIRIISNHDNTFSYEIKSKKQRLLAKVIYPRTQKIIVPTGFAKKDIIQTLGLKESLVIAIPNWSLMKIRNKSFLTRKYDIAFIGRFAKQKNIKLLVQIIKKICVKIPQLHILIMGEGKEKKEIKQLVSNDQYKSMITVKKPSLKIGSILEDTKILLFASLYEGHPVIMIEGMRKQCLIVSSYYPGIEEYLQNKETGYIGKNEKEISTLLYKILSNDKNSYNEIRNNASEVSIRNFGISPLKKYIEIITNSSKFLS